MGVSYGCETGSIQREGNAGGLHNRTTNGTPMCDPGIRNQLGWGWDETYVFTRLSDAFSIQYCFPVTESKEPLYMFNPIGSKATVCAFTLTPNVVITGHESGKVALFNVKTGEEVDSNERAHSDVVTDLQMSKDWTYCITSSKDKAARVRLFLLSNIEKIGFN